MPQLSPAVCPEAPVHTAEYAKVLLRCAHWHTRRSSGVFIHSAIRQPAHFQDREQALGPHLANFLIALCPVPTNCMRKSMPVANRWGQIHLL